MKEGKQGGGYRRHSTRCYKSVLRTFNRGKLPVERQSVRRVVQSNVLNIMIAGFAASLEHGRLEDRHAHRPLDPRFRLTGMNQLSLNMLELFLFQDKHLRNYHLNNDFWDS